MPLYGLTCPCGGTEGASTVAEREANNKHVPCYKCGELAPTATVNKLPVHGQTWPGGKRFAQLGRSFDNAKQMEKWADANGFEPVSPSSDRWTNLKNNSKQLNNDEAKAQGFRDAEDRHNTTRTQADDLLERNQANALKKAENAPEPDKPVVKNMADLA